MPGADLQALGGPCRGDFEEPPSSLSPTRVIAAECAYQVVVEAEIFPPILNLLKDFDVYVRKNAATCIREAPREKPTFPLVVRCRSRRYPDSIAMRPIDRRTAAAQLPAADMEGGARVTGVQAHPGAGPARGQCWRRRRVGRLRHRRAGQRCTAWRDARERRFSRIIRGKDSTAL